MFLHLIKQSIWKGVVDSMKLYNYYNTNTVKAVAIALGIYAMAIVMYYTSQRNYIPGKEFGTARFENPKQVNKVIADKDENFNRILSQNVKMSLDFRRLKACFYSTFHYYQCQLKTCVP